MLRSHVGLRAEVVYVGGLENRAFEAEERWGDASCRVALIGFPVKRSPIWARTAKILFRSGSRGIELHRTCCEAVQRLWTSHNTRYFSHSACPKGKIPSIMTVTETVTEAVKSAVGLDGGSGTGRSKSLRIC
jgi:hypothetical protein